MTLKWKIVALGSITGIVAISLVFTILIASGALVSTAIVSASGVVATANLGVYSDSACTTKLTSIDWGTISPSSSISKTVYVKNLGTTPLTLRMSETNWNPTSANGPITLTWNRENAPLAANQSSSATLTLAIASSISGITSFSTNIVITGTG